ncbi:MAG: hypothetical protein IJG97_03905 [Bacilli bacterium]|nr:hypothetical protein [Bacilli bacterium]
MEEAKMFEAKSLLDKLNEKCAEMQEQYDQMESTNSYDAKVLKSDIDAMNEAIKNYEKLLKEVEKLKRDTEYDKGIYDEYMNEILEHLKYDNENGIVSEKGIKSIDKMLAEREEVIEEAVKGSDGVQKTETDDEKGDSKNNPQAEETEEEKKKKEAAAAGGISGKTVEEKKPLKGSDNEYIAIMQDRINKIDKKLDKLRKREKYDLTGRTTEAIKGFEIEINALKEQINNPQGRTKLSAEVEEKLEEMDAKHSKNVDQINQYEQEIAELKRIRNTLTSRKDLRENKKILKKLQAKNIELKISDKSLTDQEGHMMQPGYKDEMKGRSKTSKQAGIISSNEDSLAVNEELRSMLNPDKLVDRIQDKIYDIQGSRYRKRIEKAQKRLEELQSENNKNTVTGVRIMTVTKDYLDKIRRTRSQEIQPQVSNLMAA